MTQTCHYTVIILIVFARSGMFDFHNGDGSALSCGRRPSRLGFQMLEAFNFALQYVNQKRGMFSDKLDGLTLGGVALDSCSSPVRAAATIANIHSGQTPLHVSQEDVEIDQERILAYIGGLEAETTQHMAQVLDVLKLPQISYGSSSSKFNDRTEYPMLLRTVPSDEQQARAVVSLLKEFDLKYVQVLYSSGLGGQSSAYAFMSLAAINNICVVNNASYTSDADATVASLLEHLPTRVVILFLDTEDIPDVLTAVDDNEDARAELKFIAGGRFSDDTSALQGRRRFVTNIIAVGSETSNVADFDVYMDTKTPGEYPSNPWFNERYEQLFQCSLSQGSCPVPYRSIPFSEGYRQHPLVLYTVNAVFAAALGLHEALGEKCGSSGSLCDDFLQAADRGRVLYDGIQHTQFSDATRNNFRFGADRAGNRGFFFYEVTEGTRGDFSYRRVSETYPYCILP